VPRGSRLSWFRLGLSKDMRDDYISTRWQAGCQGNARRFGEAGARVLRVPARPGRPEPVRSFGTSGHRGSPLRGSFTETHILAITQAICDYRQSQGTDGPLHMGKDTHALSAAAQRTALEVLAGNGVETISNKTTVSHQHQSSRGQSWFTTAIEKSIWPAA
jgi:Phosphoglucomutase/phosphomannomutase, alpha/beta/alpha domain I